MEDLYTMSTKKSKPLLNLADVSKGVLYWIKKGRRIFQEYFGCTDFEQAVAKVLFDESIAYFYKNQYLLNASEGGYNKYGRYSFVVSVNPAEPKLNGTYFKDNPDISWVEDVKQIGATVMHLAVELANYDSTIANLLIEARGGGHCATDGKTATTINEMLKQREKGTVQALIVDKDSYEEYNYVETRNQRGGEILSFTQARRECYNTFKEALGKPIDTDKRSQTNLDEVYSVNALSEENRAHIESLASTVHSIYIKMKEGK